MWHARMMLMIMPTSVVCTCVEILVGKNAEATDGGSACPGAPGPVADGGTCTTATHNVVYDVPKPVASSSRRRFEENYDDVMRSCETGENATH